VLSALAFFEFRLPGFAVRRASAITSRLGSGEVRVCANTGYPCSIPLPPALALRSALRRGASPRLPISLVLTPDDALYLAHTHFASNRSPHILDSLDSLTPSL
jgi:hypothetical protein